MTTVLEQSIRRLETLPYFRLRLLAYLSEMGQRCLNSNDLNSNYRNYCETIIKRKGVPLGASREKADTICFFTLIIRGITDYLRICTEHIDRQASPHDYLLQALEDAVLRLSFPQGTRTSIPSFSLMVKYFLFFYIKTKGSQRWRGEKYPLIQDSTLLLPSQMRKDLALALNLQRHELPDFLSLLVSYSARLSIEQYTEEDFDEVECFERNIALAVLNCEFSEFLTLPFMRVMIISLH